MWRCEEIEMMLGRGTRQLETCRQADRRPVIATLQCYQHIAFCIWQCYRSKRMVDSVYLNVSYKCRVGLKVFTNISLQRLKNDSFQNRILSLLKKSTSALHRLV